jgi:uncharacterized protein (DUF2252 family)
MLVARPRPAAAKHLSVAERVARGKAARAQVPRSSHSTYEPPPERADPIELLERQAQTRVPELVPIRYGRMLVSPFAFYRGSAMIMAHDLDATPRSDLSVQCCGDAHLSNFGMFASPERRLVFDVNDFDETLPGPWEWDVKRLAASVMIAALDNGFSIKDREIAVLETVREYRSAMRSFASMNTLDVWYARLDVESVFAELATQLKAKQLVRSEKLIAKARTRDSMAAFSKLTQMRDGKAQIVDRSPLITPISKLVAEQGEAGGETILLELRGLLSEYRSTLEPDRRVLLDELELQDLARKVVGVGSVGTRVWIALMTGRDSTDPLFLQIKQAEASVLEPLLGPSELSNHGQRVVSGQRLMQASSDILLGWLRIEARLNDPSRDFYVRQLQDWKGSFDIEQMAPKAMALYGSLCAWTLARAHARSGDRIAIASYLGSGDVFDRAALQFSKAYAEQNERDYKRLATAVRSGQLVTQTGL